MEWLGAGLQSVWSASTVGASSNIYSLTSLNLLLNTETHRFMSTEDPKPMKPPATIADTARGAIIDEAVLVEALAWNDLLVLVWMSMRTGLRFMIDYHETTWLCFYSTWVLGLLRPNSKWGCVLFQIYSNLWEAIEKGKLCSYINDQTIVGGTSTWLSNIWIK